jgi:retron-type reverse transcriptase
MLDRLRRFFMPKRDVSRLRVEGDVVAVTQEVIDTSGSPLKEGHRRRAWRDSRLLPKSKLWKRRKVMDKEEAARLFSGTMRTRDRTLRDLLPDEEQLKRHGLPVWKSEDELAAALGVSVKELRFYAIHRQRDRFFNYVRFAIPKRGGGHRVIMAPKRRLKALQRRLLEQLVCKLPVSDHAHGFRTGRGTRSNAEPHVGQKMVIRVDLKNFFPTVTFGRVRGFLIALGYGYPVATALACLMTEAERQPVELDDGTIVHVPVTHRHCVQGAPTSPGLCNVIVMKLDRRIAGLARKFGVNYTRYADDLTFSGALDRRQAFGLTQVVRRIVEEEGFTVNKDKTLLLSRARRQTVTGAVVNDVLGLSRQERRLLRAMLHRKSQGNQPFDAQRQPVSESQLQGKLAYLKMLNVVQWEKITSTEIRGPDSNGG